MIAFPSMLTGPATDAGIPIPDDLEVYEPNDFAQWHVYLAVQLGAPLPHPSAHWDNAKVVASFDNEAIKTTTYQQLLDAGLAVGNSSINN